MYATLSSAHSVGVLLHRMVEFIVKLRGTAILQALLLRGILCGATDSCLMCARVHGAASFGFQILARMAEYKLPSACPPTHTKRRKASKQANKQTARPSSCHCSNNSYGPYSKSASGEDTCGWYLSGEREHTRGAGDRTAASKGEERRLFVFFFGQL